MATGSFMNHHSDAWKANLRNSPFSSSNIRRRSIQDYNFARSVSAKKGHLKVSSVTVWAADVEGLVSGELSSPCFCPPWGSDRVRGKGRWGPGNSDPSGLRKARGLKKYGLDECYTQWGLQTSASSPCTRGSQPPVRKVNRSRASISTAQGRGSCGDSPTEGSSIRPAERHVY